MSSSPERQGRDSAAIRKAIIQRGLQVFIGTLLMGLFLFLAAGRLDWTMGWAYIGLNFFGLIPNMIIVASKNPEVIAARAKPPQEDTKGWDKVFISITAPMPFVIMVVSGLDAGRHGWSIVEPWVEWLGISLFVIAWLLTLWVMVANKYFEGSVRIQKDRDQKTVTSGPYGIVRHPGYVAFSILYLATPLFLGSWWGLIPAGLIAFGFIYRTAREDRTLMEELADYPAYAQKVRYRLVPGVW
jgi:protein-S-isoprenylcysteine O-methyltransferase Ste14